MIDDFEAVMMKMEEIHSQWPSLRFCQVIELATDAVKNNFNLMDCALMIMLDEYIKEN